MNVNLPFGLQDGKIIEISAVENGLACNCICPCCRKQLIARKGKIKKHHFDHFDSKDCNGGVETALGILALEILEKHKRIVLPSVYLTHSVELLFGPQAITFDKVILERIMSHTIPDIIIFTQNTPLLIEIRTTHSDWFKSNKVIQLGYSAIEFNTMGLFDFSHHKVFGYQDFEKRLIEETSYKRWINNNKENKIKKELKKLAVGKKIIELNIMDVVDSCPINKRVWKSGLREGLSYASVHGDCIGCQYGEVLNNEVLCSGHRKEEFYELLTKFRDKKRKFDP